MNFRELDELIKFGETEFRRLRGIPPLPQAVVEKLCIELRLSPEEFCDTFSRRVAREYAVGNLPFEIADAAMNALEGYAQFVLDADLPPYSWEVYLAFDQGEFHHPEDQRSVDPEQKYTRPAILSILERQQNRPIE